MKKDGSSQQLLLANRETADVCDFLPKNYPHAMGQMIIEPNDDIRNQGLRLLKNKANWDSFVLTGCNDDPANIDGVSKMGQTSSQFRKMLSNKYLLMEQEAKPQFTGTPFNIPLNAVMFAQKVLGYPICWNVTIPIDCYIDVDGHVRINTMCQLSLPDNFCVQVCDSYALHNQSS
ncbi:MAG: hypothetical protein EZS28_007272 [Streblomastix strix]|uniref:Uncharacterized protein n=1 Tax=Streblomastix strix TaxID=222440 RepID=A0A5J4WQH4_9EUKA|nr:MAG: hypothetical protein EZS28_007272 [Streblomastix strix]